MSAKVLAPETRHQLVYHLVRFVALPDLSGLLSGAHGKPSSAEQTPFGGMPTPEFLHRWLADIDRGSTHHEHLLRLCEAVLLDTSMPGFAERFNLEGARSRERLLTLLAYDGYIFEDGHLVACA